MSGSSRSTVAWCYVVLMLVMPCAELLAQALWRNMAIRSEAEFQRGMPGGEGYQCGHSTTRARSNPDRLYHAHDMGQVWRSDDGGQSWKHLRCEGMHVIGAESVEADPVNADVVLAVVTSVWHYTEAKLQGIYRSEDAGETWQFVQPVAMNVTNRRHERQLFTWNPASERLPETQRTWYAAVTGQTLYKSVDGGRSWAGVSPLSMADFGQIDFLRHHPVKPQTLYLGCAKGLFLSSDGGVSFLQVSTPEIGRARTIDFDPAHPDDFFISIDDKGVFRTSDGGRSFVALSVPENYRVRRIAVHPTKREMLFLSGARATHQTHGHLHVSHDGGASWTRSKVTSTPWSVREGPQKYFYNAIFGDMVVVLPDPRDANVVYANGHAFHYRSTDGGLSFQDSSTGYTGMTPRDFWFDPGNPDRYTIFMVDCGLVTTTTNGDWFNHRGLPGSIIQHGHSSTIPADKVAFHYITSADYAPVPDSQVIVGMAGAPKQSYKLILSEDDARTWTVINHIVPTGLIRFHRQDANVLYAGNWISLDGGRTFSDLGMTVIGIYARDSDIVYARKANELFRSDDRGRNWRAVGTVKTHMFDGRSIVFAVHPTNPDVFYAPGTGDDLARYEKGKPQALGLVARVPRLNLPDGHPICVHGVLVDPNRPQLVYATTSMPGTSFVWRSRDEGRTWEDITGNLPLTGRGGMYVNPHNGDLFMSLEGHGTWILPYQDADAN